MAASLLLAIPRRTLLEVAQTVPAVEQYLEAAATLHTLQRALCPDVRPDEVHRLAAQARTQAFHQDEVICQQGELVQDVALLRSGAVLMRRTHPAAGAPLVTYLQEGHSFGDTALLGGTPGVHEATVTAATRCEALRIPKDPFMAFVRDHPPLAVQLQRQSQHRLLQTVLGAPLAQTTEVMDQLDLASSTDVLLIDAQRCTRCNNCVTACAATHQGQTRLQRAAGPSLGRLHVPVACHVCDGAPCLQECSVGEAIVRDGNGVVQIIAEKCHGCGNCAAACPYKAIFIVERPTPPTFWGTFRHIIDFLRPQQSAAPNAEQRQIAVKCDLCCEVEGGPACVQHCPTGAAIRVQRRDLHTLLMALMPASDCRRGGVSMYEAAYGAPC